MTDWTPKLVADELIAAVRWARQFGNAPGPTIMRGSMPTYIASLADHLEEGWGIPEVAGDEAVDDRVIRIPVSPARAQQFETALWWIGAYVAGSNPGAAQMLSLWLKYKTQGAGKGFDSAVRRRGLSRGHAYRLRDRALSIIAQHLTAAGVSADDR